MSSVPSRGRRPRRASSQQGQGRDRRLMMGSRRSGPGSGQPGRSRRPPRRRGPGRWPRTATRIAALWIFILVAADAERPPAADALAVGVAVGRLDPLDPGRGDGVEVDRDLQVGQAFADRLRQQRDARRARGDDDRGARRAPRSGRPRPRSRTPRAACPTTLADRPRPSAWARSSDREPTATSAPSRARSRATRWPTGPVPARTAALAPSTDPPDPSSAARTAAAAVVFEPLASNRTETRNGPKKVVCRPPSRTASAAATSDPPTKIADRCRSAAPSGEEGPVDQVADRLGPDPAVAEQVVDPRVDRHHAVEDARLGVGVELDQDRGLGGVGHDRLVGVASGRPVDSVDDRRASPTRD